MNRRGRLDGCLWQARAWLVFLSALLGIGGVLVVPGAAQRPETRAELQEKYAEALREIARLKDELEKARQEIEQLKQQRDSPTAPTSGERGKEGAAPVEARQYQEAVAALTKSIEASPQDATLYRNRGIAYTHLGQYDQAFQDLNKAIKLDSRDAISYNQRGIVYYQLEKYAPAVDDFTKAIERNAELAEAYQNRGIVHRKLGNYSQAIPDLRKAVQAGLEFAPQYLQVVRDEVQQAQERLKKAGFDPGPADGLPGGQTITALRTYQRSQGLPTTGLLDEATKAALGLQAVSPAAPQGTAAEAAPQFVHQPRPEYPLEARQQGWEGTVVLRFELLADGTVGQVEIAKSSGHAILDTAARDAIKQWTHTPLTHEGSPLTRWTTLNVNFTLDKTPEANR